MSLVQIGYHTSKGKSIENRGFSTQSIRTISWIYGIIPLTESGYIEQHGDNPPPSHYL